jgi:hypothetical protein
VRYWSREIAGWLLLILGLCGFYVCFALLLGHHTLDAVPLVFISFIVFRGGIQLIKVAIAARICAQAQEQLAKAGPPPLTAPTTGRSLPRPPTAQRPR